MEPIWIVILAVAGILLLVWAVCAFAKSFTKVDDGVAEAAVVYPLAVHSSSPVFGSSTSGFSTQTHRFACNPRYRNAARRSLPSNLYDEIVWDDLSDDLPPLFELIGNLIVGPDYYTYSDDGVIAGMASQDVIDSYQQSPSYDAGDNTDNSGNYDGNTYERDAALADADARSAQQQAQDNAQQNNNDPAYQSEPVYEKPDVSSTYERPDTSSTYEKPDVSSTYEAPAPAPTYEAPSRSDSYDNSSSSSSYDSSSSSSSYDSSSSSSSYDSSSSSSSDSSGGSYDS